MLLRIWSDRLTSQELEDISNEMEITHKSMKNAMEMVFATSPLLALHTSGWGKRAHHSTYLLRVSDGLLVSFAFIEYQEDLCCPRQQSPSNLGGA
jgi:hypothetical protein